MFILKRASTASLLAAMMVMTYAIGCQNSGNQLQPSSPQGASASGARQIEVHTEDQPGHRSNDDKLNCFRQDDSRDVVVTVTADEIQSEKNVAIRLWEVPKNKILFPKSSPKIQSGSAEFRFNDGRRELREHLGPGPYVATADVVPTNRSRSIPHYTLSVLYDTYEKDPSKCRN